MAIHHRTHEAIDVHHYKWLKAPEGHGARLLGALERRLEKQCIQGRVTESKEGRRRGSD